MKLTTAQKLLLNEVYNGQRKTVDPAYKPAIRLESLRLVWLTSRRFGDAIITLTELGISESRRLFG